MGGRYLKILSILSLSIALLSSAGELAHANISRSNAPGISLGIASVPNLRDIGGYTTKDGYIVRRHVAYRSSQLDHITPVDMKSLQALGLKYDFDLRTALEHQASPDVSLPSVKEVWLDVLADEKEVDAAALGKLLENPVEASTIFGGGKSSEMFMGLYREFVTLPSAQVSYHQLFVELSNKKQLPALYHCGSGKDRTGWATAALLTLLGVSEDQVYADYLRSNDYLLPAYQSYIDHFVAEGGDRAIILDILGVKTEYLRAAFDEMKIRYGTIENYFEQGLGIDRAGQQRLLDRFLLRNRCSRRS